MSKVKTEEVTYPCPTCGVYNKPFMHNKAGFAFMLCSGCKVQYKTSTKVSANFRKYCSRIARKPNRSQTYYSSSERALKTYLERKGLIEGLNFQHNVRIRAGLLKKSQEFKGTDGKKHKAEWKYYWLDFVIPELHLVVEVDPEIWHKLWGREKSDKEKKIFINSFSWELLSLNSEAIRKLNREADDSKRPEACKKLDEMIGKLQKGVS